PFPTYYTWVQDPGWGMSSSNWNDWGGWDSDWRIADFNGNGIMDIGIPMSINAIINDVQDPCLSIQVENALDIGFTNDISDVMESIFGNSTDFNLIIKQGSNFPNDEWAKTNAQGGSSPYGVWLDVAITLNDNKLPSASQEFIMATIYHELLHARLTYEGIPSHASQQQHNEMADCYI